MDKTNVSPHQRLKKYASQDIAEICQELHLSPGGLREDQADRMRRRYGTNRVGYSLRAPLWHHFARAFVNPFSIILLAMAVVTFAADRLLPAGFSRNGTTVAVTLSMLVLSGVIRLVQELRAGHDAGALLARIQTTVQVRRQSGVVQIPAEELTVGDIVLLSPGDRVPADLRLVCTRELFVSQSVLTGESRVLQKNTAPLDTNGLSSLDSFSNLAFMGSVVLSGTAEGIVVEVGANTVYGSYLHELQKTKHSFDQGSASIARVLVRFMATLVPFVFLLTGLTKGHWLASLLFALSAAVGLIPELLPMVVNACLIKGGLRMGRRQTIVKNINAMQSFGGMDMLCVDKTGTLTGDEVRLARWVDVTGAENDRVLDGAYLNGLYHSGVSNHLDHAILQGSHTAARQQHFHELAASTHRLDELPFDHLRKRVSVLLDAPEGRLILTKGSVNRVLGCCTSFWRDGQEHPIDRESLPALRRTADEMAREGMKVLAVAFRPAEGLDRLRPQDESGLTLLGYVALSDAPKASAAAALEALRGLHVGVKVLTGDQKEVALAVCGQLGVSAAQALTGEELEAMDPAQRAAAVEQTSVFAELAPAQKALVVRLLRENGHTVGFLGDGMNDLLGMAASDVGISVDTAVPAAKEWADVILLKKDLGVLKQGILEGRRAFANMVKYVHITASSNFGNVLSIVLAGVLFPFVPMSSVQLLWLHLLYNILCMTLPWDKVDADILARPCVWSGRTLGRFMRVFGTIRSVFDLLCFAFLYFVVCASADGQSQFITLFHSGWFLFALWSQVAVLHVLRTHRMPFVKSRAAGVVWVFTAAGLAICTLAAYTPVGVWLGLAPLPGIYFAFLAAAVPVYLLTVGLAKQWYVKTFGELL